MPKTEEKVMGLVEDELKKNPKVSTSDLFDKAKKASSAIGKLTLRQFHARYPLQVKRRRSQSTSKKPRRQRGGRQKAATTSNGREAVRQTLLAFASDMAAAEERKDLVKVLADVDKYVDRVMKAAAQ